MLPCVCSVIDHRWRQNVVRTKKWHTRRSRVCHWCSYHILTSSVIYYWIRQHGIYLFDIITKSLFYFNVSTFCPAFARKKPFGSFDVIYNLYKMKQFNWLLCVAKNCDWSTKIAPLSNLTRASLLVEWTAKAELNCEIYKSWRKCWKNEVSFCHRCSPVSRKAWTLPWKLRELKKYPWKTCGCVQPRGHLIRVVGDSQISLI